MFITDQTELVLTSPISSYLSNTDDSFKSYLVVMVDDNDYLAVVGSVEHHIIHKLCNQIQIIVFSNNRIII